MKKISYILFSLAVLLGVASCKNEAPFDEWSDVGEGKVLTSSLSVELKTDENMVRSDNGAPDINSFRACLKTNVNNK